MKKGVIFIVSSVFLITSCVGTKNLQPFRDSQREVPLWMKPEVNQIGNGDFSQNDSGWNFYLPGGNAKASYGNNKVMLTITSTGNVNYGVQYYYDGFRLYQGGDYTLRFRASANKSKQCEVRLQMNGGDYHAYAGGTFTFTPEEQLYTISFSMSENSDMLPRLVFNLGKFDGENTTLPVSVTFSDISLLLRNEITVKEKTVPPVRTNQIGYLPNSRKIGYVKVMKNGGTFRVIDEVGKVVFSGRLRKAVRDEAAHEYTAAADFSKLTAPGTYRIETSEGTDYPFVISSTVYDDLAFAVCRFFTLQRCGIVDDPVFGHPACHQSAAVVIGTTENIDVTGGWHDAGDYGRYVVAGAKAVADLLDSHPKIEKSGKRFDLLAEIKWELDWMLKMQRMDGAVYHKVTCHGFPPFEMPQYETDKLVVSPVSTPATADFAAVMALASVRYKAADPRFSDTVLAAAEKAWNFLKNNKPIMFSNPFNVTTGEYRDFSDADERYFAALALFSATGDQSYIEEAKKLRSSGWKENFGWQQMEGYGDEIVLNYADMITDRKFVAKVKNAVLARADDYVKLAQASGYGIAMDDYEWGSNMDVLNRAHLLLLAAKIRNKSVYTTIARAHLDYILGCNPLSQCFVTGFGTKSPKQPHHRPSIALGTPMPGMLVGGPDEHLEDPFAKNVLEGKPPMLCYLDSNQSYSTNEVTIYWNSPLVYCLSELVY